MLEKATTSAPPASPSAMESSSESLNALVDVFLDHADPSRVHGYGSGAGHRGGICAARLRRTPQNVTGTIVMDEDSLCGGAQQFEHRLARLDRDARRRPEATPEVDLLR